jgi:pimeloyl-ACP methyl ester carboxylesterase
MPASSRPPWRRSSRRCLEGGGRLCRSHDPHHLRRLRRRQPGRPGLAAGPRQRACVAWCCWCTAWASTRGATRTLARLIERLGLCGARLRPLRPRGFGRCAWRPAVTDQRLVEDLADILGSTRKRMQASTPLILLGHSMGGLVAAQSGGPGPGARWTGWCFLRPRWTRGSPPSRSCCSPCCHPSRPICASATAWTRQWISHDPQVVQAYQQDRLIHDRISARLARYIAETGPLVLAAAPRWQVPTLLLYAGVRPAGQPARQRRPLPRLRRRGWWRC